MPARPMTEVQIRSYQGLSELYSIRDLVEETLSEPYSVFTYHYFLQDYPQLTFTAWHGERLVGVAMGRVNAHCGVRRGYIGMLSVSPTFRGQGIGNRLAERLVKALIILEAVDEIVLETEVSNAAALRLYGRLGFIREKRLPRYYLNGSDAFRFKLWINFPERIPGINFYF